jgi:hypothetical protein
VDAFKRRKPGFVIRLALGRQNKGGVFFLFERYFTHFLNFTTYLPTTLRANPILPLFIPLNLLYLYGMLNRLNKNFCWWRSGQPCAAFTPSYLS